MRRILLTALVSFGVLVLIIAGLLIYGAFNLNSLVKNNRQYVLDRVGDTLGREVEAQDIHIGLGWGVTLEIAGLQVADDPSFSQLPFVKAKAVSGQVEVLPLLTGHILITRLDVLNPEIRVIRNQSGGLNIATLGPSGPTAQGQARARHKAGGASRVPIHFLVQTFTIKNGAVTYKDGSARPLGVGHLNLTVTDVNPSRPFPVKLALAALGGTQNLSVDGTVGPLLHNGALQLADVPFSLNVTAGPLSLDRLRNLPELRPSIPDKLSMPDPVTVRLKLQGTPLAANFDAHMDLSPARVVYLGLFTKPAGTPFQISAAGVRRGAAVAVSNATIKLADLEARLTQVTFGHGNWSAKLDTNRFDLAPLSKMAAPLSKYDVSGSSEAHLAVASAAPVPRANGTVALNAVGLKVEGSKLPGISALTGTVRLAGNTATLEPANFNLGSAHASLQGQASSLQPLRATYAFSADGFKLAELAPQRPPDEHVAQVKANGTIAAANSNAVTATTALTSGQGLVADVPYRNLALRADYDGKQVNVSSLTLDAYGGSIRVRADTVLAAPRPFRAAINLNRIDLQQALSAQKAKAANIVRGLLSGQINAAGRGATFEEIKPTLTGDGHIQITQGKLVGINVVGSAIKKINGIPAIGTLFTPAVVERHPSLFASPDTDLKLVRMSYVMTGPRMTSRDILVQSDDYVVKGSGWFDMDKNVDLSMHVLMSPQFSNDLRAEKKNVVYLENQAGQIEIPLLIRGTLPHPSIQPDVQYLVQLAANRAVQQQGQRLLNRYLGNKGVGKFLGGGGGAGPSANPIAPLENLFR
jgi:uncharacterized protein involved in outer membrane biogenesis